MFVVLTTSTSNSHHGAAPVVVGLGRIVTLIRVFSPEAFSGRGERGTQIFAPRVALFRAPKIADPARVL